MGWGEPKVSCNTLDRGLVGLSHPREIEDEQKMALRSQKATCCLRAPGFISYLQPSGRGKQPPGCGAEIWLPREEETLGALCSAEETKTNDICLRPVGLEDSCYLGPSLECVWN